MTGAALKDGRRARALVIGVDSLVGGVVKALCASLNTEVEGTSRRAGSGEREIFLDLSRPDFAVLERGTYDVAIVCAAVTDMRACQNDPEGTRRINVDHTLEAMRRLADRGVHLVFLSSSQVFDGEVAAPAEDEPTCPKNVYGEQKVAVEQAIASELLSAAVLRVTKVLAPHPVGVFKGWFEALSKGTPITPASNMDLSPVMVADVARAALALGQGEHRGIWHLGSSDGIGYADAARIMAGIHGFPPNLVAAQAVTEGQVPTIYRHRHVTLRCDKIRRELGMPVRSARDVIDALFSTFGRPDAAGGAREP